VYGTFVQSTYEDKEERDVYLLSKKFSHVTFGPREDRVQVSHILDSDSDCTDTPDSKRTQVFHMDSELGDFFCWKLDFVHFPTQLESPSNSSGALSCGRNNLMLQQNPSQTTSPKVLHHLHLGPLALYDLDLVLGCLGTSSHLLGRHPLLLYK